MDKDLKILLAGSAWGQKFSGVEKGPEAIWDKSDLAERIEKLGIIYQEVKRDQFPFQSCENIKPVKGRINNSEQAGQASLQILKSAQSLISRNSFLLTLGGDHSIAFATIAVALIETDGELCVFWVDAHEDFNTPDTSRTGKFHGMPLAALTHEFDIRKHPGFENFPQFPPLKSENLALIGIRDLDGGAENKIHKSNAKIYTMAEIDQYGIGQVMNHAYQAVNPKGKLPVHLSFDIDALDPAIAPATGTRVDGGLTYREANYIAQFLAEKRVIKSMDMVEVNPDLSGADITVSVANKIILSALGQRIMPKWLEI